MAALTWACLFAFAAVFGVAGVNGSSSTRNPTWSQTANQCGRADSGGFRFLMLRMCPVSKTDDVAFEPFGWGGWTHKPFCSGTYCVFTNAMFRKEQGVSFVTTPQSIGNLPMEVLHSSTVHQESIPPRYEVKPIPGKGKGVLATTAIRQDDIVMVDSASLIGDANIPAKMKRADGVRLFTHAIEQLPEPDRLLTLATRNSDGQSPVAEDVLMTNAFTLPLDKVDRMVLFHKIARINHACDPNVMLRWNQSNLETTAVALRDIEIGEEITVSYIQIGMTWAARYQALSNRWGFKCRCSLCSASGKEIRKSDERRERVAELRRLALEEVNKGRYRQSLDHHREIIKLVQQENLFSKLGENYWAMAQLHSALMDRRNAVKYTRMAHYELSKYKDSGNDMEQTIKELETFLAANQ